MAIQSSDIFYFTLHIDGLYLLFLLLEVYQFYYPPTHIPQNQSFVSLIFPPIYFTFIGLSFLLFLQVPFFCLHWVWFCFFRFLRWELRLLLTFQTFGEFPPTIFWLLICSVSPLSESICCLVLTLSNFLKFVLWSRIWSILMCVCSDPWDDCVFWCWMSVHIKSY